MHSHNLVTLQINAGMFPSTCLVTCIFFTTPRWSTWMCCSLGTCTYTYNVLIQLSSSAPQNGIGSCLSDRKDDLTSPNSPVTTSDMSLSVPHDQRTRHASLSAFKKVQVSRLLPFPRGNTVHPLPPDLNGRKEEITSKVSCRLI